MRTGYDVHGSIVIFDIVKKGAANQIAVKM